MRIDRMIVTALIALSPAVAAAQPEANVCLPLNRVYSTKVIDSQTLQATDYRHRQYTVHMTQKCVGLDKLSQNLSFRRAAGIGSEYQCIQHGDTVGYSFPGDPSMGLRSITVHGPQNQMQCTIDSVSAGPP
jgi:hypothetical protein